MDVEFKLFGFFTVKQFGYLAAGFILSLLFYYTEMPLILKYLFIGVSMGGGLFLALVKINGQPSVIWIQNFITSMFEPQERLWRKTPVVPDILKPTPVSKKVDAKPQDSILSRARVVNLPEQPLEKLSEEEEMLDKYEETNLNKIDEHFDFLFNQVPKLQGEKPMEENVAKETPPEQKMVYKKPATLAESVKDQYSQEKLYEASDYAVAYRPMKNQTVRPVNFEPQQNQQKPTPQAVEAAQVTITNPQNPIYLNGHVLNSKEEPVVKAQVNIVDLAGNVVRTLMTANDGKFALSNKLTPGEYYLDVLKPELKFDRIRVNILPDKLQEITIKSKN
jgi:hypothetical protein